MTYLEFIEFCRTKELFGFVEIHHIEPLSIGGVDISSNRIALLPKDHYNAHKLLALEHPYNLKLWQAWWQVYVTHNYKNHKDYAILRKKLYELPILRTEESKRNRSIATKKQMDSLTMEQRISRANKISQSNKKAYQNKDARNRVSEALKLKWQDETYREKVIKSRKLRSNNYHHTEEHKAKMSALHKGTKWFTNGAKNILAYECPNGYRPGITKGLKK